MIVATGGATLSLLPESTRSVPIVFTSRALTPLGSGFVDSLSRPGGNATGFEQFEYGVSGEVAGALLKEIAPGVKRAAIFWDPRTSPLGIGQFAITPHRSRRRLGIDVIPIERSQDVLGTRSDDCGICNGRERWPDRDIPIRRQ